MLFVDESGGTRIPPQPHPESNYFAFGGIIIHSRRWADAFATVRGWCLKYEIPHDAELKWRDLVRGSGPFSKLGVDQRWGFYRDVFASLAREQLAVGVVVIVDKYRSFTRHPYINGPEDIYRRGFRYCLQRFLLFLSDHDDDEAAMVIADKRSPGQDAPLQRHYVELMNSPVAWAKPAGMAQIARIIEGLLMQDSSHSLGLQLADLLVGGVLQRYRRRDERWYTAAEAILRRSPSGQVSGYGLVLAA